MKCAQDSNNIIPVLTSEIHLCFTAGEKKVSSKRYMYFCNMSAIYCSLES